ncbi:hypothetical protein [Nonomuraea sp. NPDC049709]|uniref:hypothetical protein n=1 Tax=Nonomuraea sp. NPDC049709 TaxID=3154736 RepID=UPI003416770A
MTNKDELKEKAKDLPLLVVQTTLSAAGQALLLVDRMKNSIKGIGRKEEEREEVHDSRPSAAEQVAVAPAEAEEDKPERKEPVIFAPRSGTAEPNGVAKTKPDPVIFAPAGKAEPVTVAEPETEAAPKAESATKTDVAPKSAPKSAPKPAPEPAPAPEAAPKAAEPVAAPEPAPAPEPAAATAEPTRAPEPAAPAAVDLAEPLPGYSELTVASLRARMRGKSAEQIGDYLAYERATTARPEVIRMFENRLAKLQAGE